MTQDTTAAERIALELDLRNRERQTLTRDLFEKAREIVTAQPDGTALLFAADQHVSKLGVFAASSAALVLSSLLAVLVGAQLSLYVSPRVLKLVAGAGFVAIGIWVLLDARAS